MTIFEDTGLYGRLKYAKHGVIVAVGTGQKGKTVLLNALANNTVFRYRDIALVNYPPEFVNEEYPPWYRAVKWDGDVDEFPKLFRPGKDIIIIDDAAWLVGARDHATKENKAIQKLITIASHYDLFIFVSIQSMAMLDIAMLMSQDVIILHKEMDLTSLRFERDEFQSQQGLANKILAKYFEENPGTHPKAVTYCSTTWETFVNGVPPFWKPEMSKPFRGRIPT